MARRSNDPMAVVTLSKSFPRWVVEEMVRGMEIRASFHYSSDRQMQAKMLNEHANQIKKEFLS